MADPIIVLTPTAYAPISPYSYWDTTDAVINLLRGGTGIRLDYNGVADTLTIVNTNTGGGGVTPITPITLGALTLSPTTFTVGA